MFSVVVRSGTPRLSLNIKRNGNVIVIPAKVRWHATNGATSILELDALPQWREY
jgi:hypothetical protein